MVHLTRIETLQKTLKQGQALLIESPTDLYYLTGQEVSLGTLLLTQKEATFIVDSRYIEACQNGTDVPCSLLTKEGLKPFLSTFKKILFCSEQTPYARVDSLKKMAPHAILKGILNPVSTIRLIKSNEEIQALNAASKLAMRGFEYVLTLLKEGVTEIEVAKKLEIFWLEQEGEGLGFSPIIAFGENSSKPHYHPSSTALKKGELVLIDIGVIKEHYHSDMTRTVAFGEIDPELKKIYSIVKKAQMAALSAAKPGAKMGEVDTIARTTISEAGYGDQFTHNLGHGVGLEIHEDPSFNDKWAQTPLQEGMAITIEPGIYLPGLGGVRIEDTIIITEKGHSNLTKLPKTLLQVAP